MHHPDVNREDPLAPAKFAEINEAYHALCAERGNLSNVGTEEWKEKWSAQLRQMKDVEAGKARVNVRRRRVVRKTVLDETMEKERERLEDIMRESEAADGDDAWLEDEVPDEAGEPPRPRRWLRSSAGCGIGRGGGGRWSRRRRTSSRSRSRTCRRPRTTTSGTTRCSEVVGTTRPNGSIGLNPITHVSMSVKTETPPVVDHPR